MGQKTNLLTLKSSFVNLNLQTQNPNFFLYGYFFAEVIQKIFNQKNVVVSNWTSNFVGNSLFINIHLYYKTVKLFFLKKKKFQKNQNLLHVQDTMLHNLFSKILFKNLLFLKTHFLIFSIKVLNKEFKLKKNKILLKFFFLKSQSFLNILFQRRFSFFFDFLKQIILLLQGFLNSSVFLQSWSLLFKYLHKKMHTRFFVFFNLISNLIIHYGRYEQIKLGSKIKGLKLLIKGKLQGKMRASLKYLQEGKIPTQSFSKKVDIAKQSVCTLYGVFGLTLWIHRE